MNMNDFFNRNIMITKKPEEVAIKGANDETNHNFDAFIGESIHRSTHVLKDELDENNSASASKDFGKRGFELDTKNFVETVKGKATEAYNYVAGNENEGKGFVGTIKEKATEAYYFVTEKVNEATHAVSGNDSNPSIVKRTSAIIDAIKDSINDKTSETKSEINK